jgi:uridine phosphorylase
VTVGTPSRARSVASFLDAAPEPFTLLSERGFLTITGRYKEIPVSIVSIGMGGPNMDFMVREIRENLNGDMIVVRSILQSSGVSVKTQLTDNCTIADLDRVVH